MVAGLSANTMIRVSKPRLGCHGSRHVGTSSCIALAPSFGLHPALISRVSTMKYKYVAIDPSTGLHVRAATEEEKQAYFDQKPLHGLDAFRKPVRVGAFLIDEFVDDNERIDQTGPLQW